MLIDHYLGTHDATAVASVSVAAAPDLTYRAIREADIRDPMRRALPPPTPRLAAGFAGTGASFAPGVAIVMRRALSRIKAEAEGGARAPLAGASR